MTLIHGQAIGYPVPIPEDFAQGAYHVDQDLSVVESRPVNVKITPPSIMVTQPTVKPLNTRVVVVHNNMVPVPIECFQPPDSGACSKDMVRVFYDHETRTCKPFSYTGCGGNANRFLSVKNCYRICHPYRYQVKPVAATVKKQPIAVPVQPPVERQPSYPTAVVPPAPESGDISVDMGVLPESPIMNAAAMPVRMYQSVPYVQQTPMLSDGIIRYEGRRRRK